ncbi:LLM class flavin-dependent oxidoreductase, partial [Methylobacterium radiotolerans]|uniref:LLM class flavin-dependent oxidoreductase n=1 Tax=Methylobacterium radiotolerans TaxID=31998 RepID=UPI001FD9047B
MTPAGAAAGRNVGFAGASEHGARYARAREFTELVHALWDSWEDDAFVGDKAGGRFVDTGKVHAIRHRGAHYAVEGPLTVPRSPQGRPVTFQAGGSEDGRELAAA